MTGDILVAVAMSGGVDSSVTAALLLERGYRVLGLTMRLWHEPPEEAMEAAANDARAVCQALGIPHHVIDLRDLFYAQVVQPFVRAYSEGRTPNPCLTCNRALKFGALLEQARALGAQYLSTGHYARIRRAGDAWQLCCAVDPHKDQSYVLYALGQAQLASLILPLGDLTKAQVRAYATQHGLPAAERAESQDICFMRDQDYRRFLAERAPEVLCPGPILDVQGHVLGQHKGLPLYTVGQREGLGLAMPRPLYVKQLDMARNALVVGYLEELGRTELLAEEMSYVSGVPVPPGLAVEAKIRYRARRVAAQVWPLADGRARVAFAQPLRDITPGQAVVLYAGEVVLGGGIIAE